MCYIPIKISSSPTFDLRIITRYCDRELKWTNISPEYWLENGQLFTSFPIGKKFFGLVTTLEKRLITLDEIPFERYDLSFLQDIVNNIEKAIETIDKS